jgi:hypothetical protein
VIGHCVDLIQEGRQDLSAANGRVRGWRGYCECSPSGLTRVDGTPVVDRQFCGEVMAHCFFVLAVCFGCPCMLGVPVHVGS